MYIVAGIIVAIVVFLSVGYVKSPPNTATIISGPGKHPRVLIGKAGFKIPFLERVDRMGIGQIDIDIETEDYIPTKDFINIQVDAIAQVAVDTSPENIEIAMRNFLNKSSDDVRNTITKSLQGNLREIIGTMELKDICQNKAEFSEQVKSNAKEDIAQLGICILSFNVQNIKDKDGLINDLGIDNREQISKSASIAEPISSIDKVTVIGGDSNGVSDMAGNVPAVLMKVMESMKETTGVDLKGIIEANSKEAKTDRNITIRELERNDISETVEQETNK